MPLVVVLGDEHVEELLLMTAEGFILPQSGFVQQGNQLRACGAGRSYLAPVIAALCGKSTITF